MRPVKLDPHTGKEVEGASFHDDIGGDAVIAPDLKQTRN
jgi:hypothetical protein